MRIEVVEEAVVVDCDHKAGRESGDSVPWPSLMEMTTMALDVAVLSENGEPERTVSIRVNEHARLLSIVNAEGLPLLSRLTEYYEDAEFDLAELDALLGELDSLMARVRSDDELARLVAALVSLVLSAKRSGRQVLAIAD